MRSVQYDRENTGAEHGVKGGRPRVWNWELIEEVMVELGLDPNSNRPKGNDYMEALTPGTALNIWFLEEYGALPSRKTLWNFLSPNGARKKASTADRNKTNHKSRRKETFRGKLSKKLSHSKSRKKFDDREKTATLKNVLNVLKKEQNLSSDETSLVCCYTGIEIDLINDNWQLDHIDPDGGHTADNVCVTLEQINQMKNCWTIEETCDMAIQILKHLRPEVLKNA